MRARVTFIAITGLFACTLATGFAGEVASPADDHIMYDGHALAGPARMTMRMDHRRGGRGGGETEGGDLATGACCMPSGDCIQLDQAACLLIDDAAYQGDNTQCGPTGMCAGCCVSDDCLYVLDSLDGVIGCIMAGGYPGGGVLCPQDYKCQSTGDINGDGMVDTMDLGRLVEAWGSDTECFSDINGDGGVNVVDILELFSGWGPCDS